MSRLVDKVAVVTGASKGIGAAIAKALAAEGAAVVVNYASSRAGAVAVVDGDGAGSWIWIWPSDNRERWLNRSDRRDEGQSRVDELWQRGVYNAREIERRHEEG